MKEPCRVTIIAARRTRHRVVQDVTSLYDGQILTGIITVSGRDIRVYRHHIDTSWTSIREEATGAAYERLKLQPAEEAQS